MATILRKQSKEKMMEVSSTIPGTIAIIQAGRCGTCTKVVGRHDRDGKKLSYLSNRFQRKSPPSLPINLL